MKKNNLVSVLKKLYKLLDAKQKMRFILIILIMIVSAALAQMTPKTIGWLTDDILTKAEVSFEKVIPFSIFQCENFKILHLKYMSRFSLILKQY